MLSTKIKIGDQVPIEHLITDRNATKFVQAKIYDESDTLLETVSLVNFGSGRYGYTSFNMPNKKFVKVYFTVFNDAEMLTIDSSYTSDIVLFVSEQEIQTVVIDSSSSLYGTIENDSLIGIIDTENTTIELVGVIKDDSLIGTIENTDEISGKIDDSELTGILNTEENWKEKSYV